jgi:acyl-CoA synthetase (AMP-forming)/AMP-acid ligase II
MINRGGSKSAPKMIEEVLRQVPEIGDAAVFAVPNTDWAAVVCKGQLRQNEILDMPAKARWSGSGSTICAR